MLSFISLGELGIGSVIQYNLYKPLHDKDWFQVSRIISSARRFFNKLLILICVYVFLLASILPFKFIKEFDYLYTFTLVLSIAVSYFAQYYFGMAYRQLLDAEALSFVRIIPQIIAIIINVLATVLLIKVGASIQLVKLVASILFALQPICIYIYTQKKFPELNSKIEYNGEPIKQKWNGLAFHIANVITKDTDIVVLTLLSTLANISVYSIYNMIIYGILAVIEIVLNNYTALFGDRIAKGNENGVNVLLDKVELLTHVLITVVFFCIGRLIVPFVSIYTRNVTDANYIQPLFAILITCANAFCCYRLPYHIFVKAAGQYRETQKATIIEALVNIVISVALVYKLGLIGVAIGTLVAMLYKTIYYCVFLHNNVICRRYTKFVKVFLIDLISVSICCFLCRNMQLQELTYLSWIILSVKVFVCSVTTTLVVTILFYRRKIFEIIRG